MLHNSADTIIFSPGDFEQAQQSYAAEDRDPHDGHDTHVYQNDLQDTSGHHEAVEAIEQRHEVGGQAQSVHLHEHLQGEHGQQQFVGVVW